MNTAQSNNFEKLLSLQEAAKRLNVTVETLISWNEHNILKPTITKQGIVGYTETQLTQFAATVQKFIQHVSPALGQPVTAPQSVYQEIPISQPQAVVNTAFSESATDTTISDDMKQFSSKRIILFAVVLIILTSVFTQKDSTETTASTEPTQKPSNVLGSQSSTLHLSGQFFSPLPIQLTRNTAQEKQLNNDQTTNSFKKETISSTLYTNKASANNETNKSSTVAKIPEYKPNSSATLNPNSYTATALFQAGTDDSAAIDEHGNIRGEAEAETLAMVVGNIDEKIKTDSFKQANTHATNQLLFIFVGMFAVLFGLHKRLAFVPGPNKKVAAGKPVYHDALALTEEKVLEVVQKTDGSVILLVRGKEYKISKPEMNSESDQFIENLMALTYPDLKEIEYDTAKAGAIKFATPLSRLVTRLGFVGVKRDLFFPRTSKTSVLFRRYLTQEDLDAMNLTVNQLLGDMELLS